jgi:hypothetical protein
MPDMIAVARTSRSLLQPEATMRSKLHHLLLPLLAAPVAAQSLIGLSSDNRLIPLRTTAPLAAGPTVAITGLQPGEAMLAIDFRPANGRLYGFSSQGRLYTIAAASGAAAAVGSPIPMPAGTEFGFDFNPTIDRIRLVSDAGGNLVLNPDTGALQATQTPLAFAATDPNAGFAPNVAASAYTNNVATATTTVLYNLDAARDVLTTQIPPGAGTLNTIGSGLGFDVGTVGGFDIGADGIAYAALGSSPQQSVLHRIDLQLGTATNIVDLRAALGAAVLGVAVRNPVGIDAFGTATNGCAGPAWLGAAGTPFAGSTQFTVVAHNAAPNTLGFFVLAADRLPMALDIGGLQAWIDPNQHVVVAMRAHDAAGRASLVMPLAGAWFGLPTYWQWIGLDVCGPMGLATSAAMRVIVQ